MNVSELGCAIRPGERICQCTRLVVSLLAFEVDNIFPCLRNGADLYRGMPKGFLGWYAHYMIEDIQEVTTGWYTAPVLSWWEATSNFVDTGERFGLIPADNPELKPLPGDIGIDEGLCDVMNGEEFEGEFPDIRDPSEDISPSARRVTFCV